MMMREENVTFAVTCVARAVLMQPHYKLANKCTGS